MKMREIILKIIAVAAALAMALALSGCGNKDNEAVTEPSETVDPNIPLNTVAPLTEPAATETSPADVTDIAEDTEATEPEDSQVPDNTDAPIETTASETAPVATEDEHEDEYIEEELDTRTIAYLKLFNSSKVHAKFVAAESYDGSKIFTTSVEYFINGSERVYITDNRKTIVRDGVTTVVDNDLKIYFSYPEEGGYGLEFGFERSKYKLVSQSADAEVYEIDGTNITSTWSFRSDGSVRVADRAADGSFTLYDVERIESDVSMMDFTIPSDCEEVNADDYEFYR